MEKLKHTGIKRIENKTFCFYLTGLHNLFKPIEYKLYIILNCGSQYKSNYKIGDKEYYKIEKTGKTLFLFSKIAAKKLHKKYIKYNHYGELKTMSNNRETGTIMSFNAAAKWVHITDYSVHIGYMSKNIYWK